MVGIDLSGLLDVSRAAGLAVGLAIGGSGLPAVPATLGQSEQESAQGCDLIAPDVESEPWVRTELFFGMSRPDGSMISESEWKSFLDREITPRFPDGLTILDGDRQWQDEDDEIVQEPSKIVILLYPRDAISESNEEIESIRDAYERAFQQDSVLRADDDRPVCASY